MTKGTLADPTAISQNYTNTQISADTRAQGAPVSRVARTKALRPVYVSASRHLSAALPVFSPAKRNGFFFSHQMVFYFLFVS